MSFGKYNEDTFGCIPGGMNKECTELPSFHSHEAMNNPLSDGHYSSSNRVESVEKLNVLPTEEYPQNESITQEKKQVHFGDFAENLYLPVQTEDDLKIEKSDVDMRDQSINSWRNEQKNKGGIELNLREYQQKYNEEMNNDNEFKKMTIEEHRKKNIEEWEQKMRKNQDETQV